MIRALVLVAATLLATPAAADEIDLCIYVQPSRPPVACLPVGGGP